MNIDSPQNTNQIKKTKSKIVGKLKIEVCPKCESLFITSKECEACGYQFAIDRIGEPYGQKSLYSLKNSYIESLPFLVRAFPKFEFLFQELKSRYIFQLKRRFQLLAKNFENDPRLNSDFALEVQDLVTELSEYEVPREFFLDYKWGQIPTWFQIAISEGLNNFIWQKKSRVYARDFNEFYVQMKRLEVFSFAKWIFIYGIFVTLAIYMTRVNYSF